MHGFIIARPEREIHTVLFSTQISQILPIKFFEKALRVYCKNPDMADRSAMEQYV